MAHYTLKSGERHETTTLRCPMCLKVQVVGESGHHGGWIKEPSIGSYGQVLPRDLYCSYECNSQRMQKLERVLLSHTSKCSHCRMVVDFCIKNPQDEELARVSSNYEYIITQACMNIFEHGHVSASND